MSCILGGPERDIVTLTLPTGPERDMMVGLEFSLGKVGRISVDQEFGFHFKSGPHRQIGRISLLT